jgi:DNA-binding protein H-NS
MHRFFTSAPNSMHNGDNDSPPEDENASDEDRPLNRRERAAVLSRIHALMEYWGITIDDLLAETPECALSAPEEPAPKAVKYRHPVTGETWDGEGQHPEWLRRALLKEGMRLDELKPEFQQSTPPSAPDEAGAPEEAP